MPNFKMSAIFARLGNISSANTSYIKSRSRLNELLLLMNIFLQPEHDGCAGGGAQGVMDHVVGLGKAQAEVILGSFDGGAECGEYEKKQCGFSKRIPFAGQQGRQQ